MEVKKRNRQQKKEQMKKGRQQEREDINRESTDNKQYRRK